MKWSYTSYLMQQSRQRTEDVLLADMRAAREVAKLLFSHDETVQALLGKLANWQPMGSVELVYLDYTGLRKTSHASTPWSMLTHIASSEALARPVNLVFNNDMSAVNLEGKIEQVKEVVRLVREAQEAEMRGEQEGS